MRTFIEGNPVLFAFLAAIASALVTGISFILASTSVTFVQPGPLSF